MTLTDEEEKELRTTIASDGGVAGVARRLDISQHALLSVLARVARSTTVEIVRTRLAALRGAA